MVNQYTIGKHGRRITVISNIPAKTVKPDHVTFPNRLRFEYDGMWITCYVGFGWNKDTDIRTVKSPLFYHSFLFNKGKNKVTISSKDSVYYNIEFE